MPNEADMQKGSFRLLQAGGRAMIAYEPNGADLANYKGEVVVIELRADTDPAVAQEITAFLNNHVEKISLKDLSASLNRRPPMK